MFKIVNIDSFEANRVVSPLVDECSAWKLCSIYCTSRQMLTFTLYNPCGPHDSQNDSIRVQYGLTTSISLVSNHASDGTIQSWVVVQVLAKSTVIVHGIRRRHEQRTLQSLLTLVKLYTNSHGRKKVSAKLHHILQGLQSVTTNCY